MTLNFEAALATDRGCLRDSNEDAADVARLCGGTQADAMLAIVADGMGGHRAGEVASRLAVDTIRQTFTAGAGTPGEALRDAVIEANRAIHALAASDAALSGMGTTVVALVCRGEEAYAAHVGDSRLYLIRCGGAYQMTRDDSAVATMVLEGLITLEDARRHEDRNVLLKAVGTRDDVDVTWWRHPFPMQDGDVFVLCSDGLTDLVHDEDILAAAAEPELHVACRRLVDLARSRGGFDNITVIMLRAQTARARIHAPATRDARVTQ